MGYNVDIVTNSYKLIRFVMILLSFNGLSVVLFRQMFCLNMKYSKTGSILKKDEKVIVSTASLLDMNRV